MRQDRDKQRKRTEWLLMPRASAQVTHGPDRQEVGLESAGTDLLMWKWTGSFGFLVQWSALHAGMVLI